MNKRIHPNYMKTILEKLTSVQRNADNPTLAHEIARIKSGIINYKGHVEAGFELETSEKILSEYIRSAELLLTDITKKEIKK